MRREVVACGWVVLVGALMSLAGGCTTTARKAAEKRAAIYGPSESVLEVVAVLRQHVPDDTYRFAPATDFTGRNVYRASLLRLENIERIHAESLRAGRLEGVIAFAKARALERLQGYELAAQHYRRAVERDAMLAEEAQRSADVCDAIAAALQHGPTMLDPLSPDGAVREAASAEVIVGELDERVARLRDTARALPEGSHYASVIREEIERADIARARWFVSMRAALVDGPVRAVSELQRVATHHAASHRHLRHLLALADLYAALAGEYVEAVPPASLGFDPPRLRELVDAATQLYSRVASQDGAPEKLEASRRLEAFLAFTLQVDRDRFASQ